MTEAPTATTAGRTTNIVRAAAPPALFALCMEVLRRLPPGQSTFYPHCPVYEYLHLQCPGCGATRAVAALLTGHFVDALRLNGLATLLFPFALAYGVRCYGRLLQRKPLQWPQPRPAALCAMFAVSIIFAVVRNLPQPLF